MPATDPESLVRYIVTSLVDAPDKVVIQKVDTGHGFVFEVSVDPDDTGKVIGKQGRLIKAIRTLARAAGSIDDLDIGVEIIG
jgi:uncharacterized protein